MNGRLIPDEGRHAGRGPLTTGGQPRIAGRGHVISTLAVAVAALAMLATSAALAPSAIAAQSPGWTIAAVAQPSSFSAPDGTRCEETGGQLCDSYTLTVTNAGSLASDGSPVTITDTLPETATVKRVAPPLGGAEDRGFDVESNEQFECVTTAHTVTCTDPKPVPPEDTLQVRIKVTLSGAAAGKLVNEAQVSGGGAAAAEARTETPIGPAPSAFSVENFSFHALGDDGGLDGQAGEHPYAVTTSFNFASRLTSRPGEEAGNAYEPVQEARDVLVTLPLGFLGNPLATAQECPQTDLINGFGKLHGTCPAASQVGTIALDLEGKEESSVDPNADVSPVYNMVPESGQPAELGFDFLGQGLTMYASVVPLGSSYGLRVAVPGIPRAFAVNGATLTFWGTPADASHDSQRYRVNSEGTDEHGVPYEGSPEAFLTNPVNCEAEQLTATIVADSWDEAGQWTAPMQTTAYPQLSGCDMLQFQPKLEVQPQTTRADEPSGYGVNLEVPQSTNRSPLLATPELRNATVTLPAGVSVSPSAADGLTACQPRGPQGINLPSGTIGPAGEDLGDPEATELGQNHGAGAGAYDDGLYHLAAGRCSDASRIGTVRIVTPLLVKPLEGSVFVAQPAKCAAGQPGAGCSEEAAELGEVFGIYLEVAGSGVIVKLQGKVEVGGYGPHSAQSGLSPGQLRTTFAENPQLPFSDLRLSFDGGPRAPLANPQLCGAATTTSVLQPWGGAPATPPSSFDVPCEGMPFDPGFLAQTGTPLAGGYSPFELTFSRSDRQQDLSTIAVSTPPGLAGTVSNVSRCGEPAAAQGQCPPSSQIGVATVATGAGSHPLWLSGPVYLTGPYGGGPFGLSVAVPAAAGPFDLGTVVVRAAIHVDPRTAALTVVSDPLPQQRDGVPFRVQTVHVIIDRAGSAINRFTFNPTNCSERQITASISGVQGFTGTQGSTVGVATPFAVTGCKDLPFRPGFSVHTHAHHTRKGGDDLHVTVTSRAGQANIASVHVALPKQLVARVSTLNLACTERQFAANPSGCPPGSLVGVATAHTPVLPKPLSGPAIFVSHGGAAFPDLDIVLQGEGVTVILTGNTDIRRGITSNTFASVPDVPVSRFDLVLPAGPHSALAANSDLCSHVVSTTKRVRVRAHDRTLPRRRRIRKRVRLKLVMPTTITGQNGAVLKQSTAIAVAGCAAPKPVKTKK